MECIRDYFPCIGYYYESLHIHTQFFLGLLATIIYASSLKKARDRTNIHFLVDRTGGIDPRHGGFPLIHGNGHLCGLG